MLSLTLAVLAACTESQYVCVDGDQVVGGQKVFNGLVQHYAAYDFGGVYVSSINAHGASFGGPLIATTDGNGLVLRGRRAASDSAPDVRVESEHSRDAGGPFAVYVNGVPVSAVDWMGNVSAYPAPNADGTQAADAIHRGSFVDRSGISGHDTVTTMPGYNIGIAGRASENHTNTFIDGGCNVFEADSGCYASFTALHGEAAVRSTEPRPFGGWAYEYVNPVTDGTGTKRWFVDVWGGIGQRHFMIRAQFPRCPADQVATAPQTQAYFQGALESTQLYAFDEHEWYFCDGSDWQPMRTGSGSLMASAAGRVALPLGALVVAAVLLLRRRA